MAGVKISGLPAIPSCQTTDLIAEVQPSSGGTTYKATLSQVITLINANASFVPLAGGTITGAIINYTNSPTQTLELVSKGYVDSVATGLNIQPAVRLASTTALTVVYNNGTSGVGATLTNAGAMAALSLDGVATVVGNRVLIKDQASALQNGIYTVTDIGSGATNWVLTRATDFDQPSEIQPGDLVIVTAGSTLANSSWLETATVNTVGVDAINFSQFSASLPITVPNGGTGGTSFTAYGVIAAGTTSTNPFQAVTPGATGTILQSGGAAALPTWTTTTYPATNAINTIMYASSANVLGVITPVNSAVLISSAGGVPSMSTTLPSGIAATNMNLTTPTLGAATATSITFSPTTGGIVGTTTNDNAGAGKVGEYISSTIAFGSPVSLTTSVPANVTSISLTAGDWDVSGNIGNTTGAGTILTSLIGSISLTSATLDTVNLTGFSNNTATANATFFLPLATCRISIASTTTVYLVADAAFTVSTAGAYGFIGARRVR